MIKIPQYLDCIPVHFTCRVSVSSYFLQCLSVCTYKIIDSWTLTFWEEIMRAPVQSPVHQCLHCWVGTGSASTIKDYSNNIWGCCSLRDEECHQRHTPDHVTSVMTVVTPPISFCNLQSLSLDNNWIQDPTQWFSSFEFIFIFLDIIVWLSVVTRHQQAGWAVLLLYKLHLHRWQL